ncbi:MAG: hypothetical protein ACRED2_02685, partial [Methylocella sp.]
KAGGIDQSVEIESMCDECEEYAQELRDAINSAPGWKAVGGTTIFGSAAILGIRFYVRSLDNRSSTAIKLGAALDAAGLKFEWIEDTSLRYEYILVAKQVRR